MWPPIVSDTIGIVLRDPDRQLYAEIRAAKAQGKTVIIRGTGQLHQHVVKAQQKRERKS